MSYVVYHGSEKVYECSDKEEALDAACTLAVGDSPCDCDTRELRPGLWGVTLAPGDGVPYTVKRSGA